MKQTFRILDHVLKALTNVSLLKNVNFFMGLFYANPVEVISQQQQHFMPTVPVCEVYSVCVTV